MQTIKLLFRTTAILPEPVFCGVFADSDDETADLKIKNYISVFMKTFPEFCDQSEFSSGGKKILIEWTVTETELK